MAKQNVAVREILGITFLNIDEVARRMGFERQSVLKAIHLHRLPAKMVGGAWLIQEKWFNGWRNMPPGNCVFVTGLDGEPVWLPKEQATEVLRERAKSARVAP
jgi:excisionase family DNA binding protein